jgi:D-alanyl-D-alanine dipeptidase
MRLRERRGSRRCAPLRGVDTGGRALRHREQLHRRAARGRDGYIAPKSNHNLESTVDLTLIRRASGRQLDINTAFDAFTPRANTTRARGRVLRNGLILKNAMEDQSFVNYFREWWHFDSEEPGTRRLDVPIGC